MRDEYDERVTVAVHHVVTRRARKAHACCQCSRPINPGDTYEDVTELVDGDWYRRRQHDAYCWEYDAIEEAVEPARFAAPVALVRGSGPHVEDSMIEHLLVERPR